MDLKVNEIISKIIEIKKLKRLNSFEKMIDKKEQNYWENIIGQKKDSIDFIKNEIQQVKKELIKVENLNQNFKNGIDLFQKAIDEIEKLVLSLRNCEDLKEIKNLIEIRNRVYVKENKELLLALKDLDDMEKSIEQIKEDFKIHEDNLENIANQYDHDLLIFDFIQRKHDELKQMSQLKANEEKKWQDDCQQKKNDINDLKTSLQVYQPWLDEAYKKCKNFSSTSIRFIQSVEENLIKFEERFKALQIETVNQILKKEMDFKAKENQNKREEVTKKELEKEKEKEANHLIELETFQAMKDTSALFIWKEINQTKLLNEETSHANFEIERLRSENKNLENNLIKIKETLIEEESKGKEKNSQKRKELEIVNQQISMNEEEKESLEKNFQQMKECNQNLTEKLAQTNENWIKKQNNEMKIAKMLRSK